MAFTIRDVKSGFANAASTQLAAFATDPSNGDLIVVGASIFNRGSATVAVSDTAGNTYTRVGALIDAAGIPGTIAMFYSQNVVGGSSFRTTLTLSAALGHALVAYLVTGAAAAAFNGDNISLTASAQNPSIGPTVITPPTQSIFFGSLYFAAGGNNIQPGSGWNVVGSNGFTAGMNTASLNNQYGTPYFASQYLTYKISSTVETATWTSNSGSAIAMAALLGSFSAGAGGGAGSAGGGYRSRYQC